MTGALADAPTQPGSPSDESVLATCDHLLRPGEMLGVFEIVALLGEGGMGQVFEARDHALARRVAIKVGRPDLPAHLLFDEARALSAVHHPGAIAVHAIGTHRELPYVVMERIVGIDLASYLDRRQLSGDPLGHHEALDLLSRIADALAAIHGSGIAHRDVKPSNIMISPGGRVVIMDLGIAMAEGRAHHERPTTGTLEYMAPETLTGSVAPGDLFLVDVYALGVVAFEMLTGRRPFVAASPAGLQVEHASQTPPPLHSLLSDAPHGLSELVAEMLAKDPHHRPQGMRDVGFRLDAIRRGAGVVTSRPTRVLIVDDDPIMLALGRECVAAAAPRAEVSIACTADDALRQVTAFGPDLLFVDVQMPDMNGLELCMYLRGAGVARRTRVVAMSASAREQDIRVLRELGVEFLRKDATVASQMIRLVREPRRAPSLATGDNG